MQSVQNQEISVKQASKTFRYIKFEIYLLVKVQFYEIYSFIRSSLTLSYQHLTLFLPHTQYIEEQSSLHLQLCTKDKERQFKMTVEIEPLYYKQNLLRKTIHLTFHRKYNLDIISLQNLLPVDC